MIELHWAILLEDHFPHVQHRPVVPFARHRRDAPPARSGKTNFMALLIGEGDAGRCRPASKRGTILNHQRQRCLSRAHQLQHTNAMCKLVAQRNMGERMAAQGLTHRDEQRCQHTRRSCGRSQAFCQSGTIPKIGSPSIVMQFSEQLRDLRRFSPLVTQLLHHSLRSVDCVGLRPSRSAIPAHDAWHPDRLTKLRKGRS